MFNAAPATILMTADTVGGVWTYALALTRALAPYGTQVALATMGAPLSESQWQEVAAISNLTVYESHYKLEWMDKPWDDVAEAGEWLLQLQDTVQPDLIHLNGMVHGQLAWGKPVLVVVHSCVLSWWQAVHGEPAPEAWSTYRTQVQQGLQAADLVVAPTTAMLQEAARLYGPFQQQAVIYNGCDASLFQPAELKELFVFSMGRIWDEAKNLKLLAEAAPKLPWPVYIAGNAHHPTTGATLTLPNVELLGQLTPEEAATWLNRASIYVMPARYEPFGLTVLEAALAGCALVVGDIESLREVWGEAACYVRPDDAEGLHATLQHLINNPEVRHQLADRARLRAERYTTASMAKTYRELQAASLRLQAASSQHEPGV
ncbi:glycosyltransferase family 4 protein [Hymenobacter sp.]|uniref:glycosyltransferase family 4 protein n=1 Tax=Hymenobacter sp. TaxID=1898978 RepID=UPI002ED89868